MQIEKQAVIISQFSKFKILLGLNLKLIYSDSLKQLLLLTLFLFLLIPIYANVFKDLKINHDNLLLGLLSGLMLN